MKIILVNNSARDDWNIELGKYCSSINADCDICEKSDRCQELTNQMWGM